jgi:hypothetical protein
VGAPASALIRATAAARRPDHGQQRHTAIVGRPRAATSTMTTCRLRCACERAARGRDERAWWRAARGVAGGLELEDPSGTTATRDDLVTYLME